MGHVFFIYNGLKETENLSLLLKFRIRHEEFSRKLERTGNECGD
jgi:hypothetical protein